MSDTPADAIKNPLAHRGGILVVGALLLGSGAMCAKCGYGTRVTSKRWARCKKCGERVRRRSMEDVAAALMAPPNPEGTDAGN